jgi:hypothetical protein
MTPAERTLKDAVMTAIEEAVFAGMKPERVEEIILSLISTHAITERAFKSGHASRIEQNTVPPQTTTCGQCNTDCKIRTPQGWICECGKTQVFDQDYYRRNLSEQAKWYLRGNFPVYERPAVGHAAPEPKAMQELVRAGLAFFTNIFPVGNCWLLTDAGNQEKHNLTFRKGS